MSIHESRRSAIFSISLTELILILVFLMLLLLLAERQYHTKEVAQLGGNAEASKALERLENFVRQEDAFANVRPGELPTPPESDQFAEAEDDDVKAHEQFINAALQEGAQAMKRHDQLTEINPGEELEELLREHAEMRRLAKDKDLKEAFDECLAQATEEDRCEGKLADKKRQLAFFQAKAGKGGVDWPPCWPRTKPNGDVAAEFIFDVVVREENFDVFASWPGHRAKEVQFIPGASSFAGCGISTKQLKQRAQKILNWSIENNCRHTIRLYRFEPFIEFTDQREVVERYFYHYLDLNNAGPDCV